MIDDRGMAFEFGDAETGEIGDVLGDACGQRAGREGAAQGAEKLRRRDESQRAVRRSAAKFIGKPLNGLGGKLVAHDIMLAIGIGVGDASHASSDRRAAPVVGNERVLAAGEFLEVNRA